ncbi:MAG: ABC transporter permease [Acidimicrobiia bacterium]
MTGIVLVALTVPFVVAMVVWPLVRRLSFRNARRRPVEALLVIGGSLLGTAIITGSLIVGDTIDRSIRAAAYDQLGPIDELVSVPTTDATALHDQFDHFTSPLVDGTLFLTTTSAAAVKPGAHAATQPRAQLVETDFARARRFGGDALATGIVGPTPAEGRAAISRDLADKLGLVPGEPVVVYAGGGSETLTVDRVLPRRGVAGLWRLDPRQQSYNVFVAPGTIARLAATGAGTVTEPPQEVFAVSNTGGVEAGAALSDRVVAALDAARGGIAARAQPVKQDLLERADRGGKSLAQLYFTVGMFAVAAGVLLLVNVFVMLADERRSELGMLRAMGMRRSVLVGALASEGWMYAALASALGALLGIAFGRLIALRADQILTSGREVNALHLTFTFDWSTVLEGFALGFAIAVVTIVASSARIARFNVIRAIRDQHESVSARPPRRWAALGLVTAALGALLSVLGVAGPEAYSLMVGPMLVAIGLVPVLARRLPNRAVVAGACVCVLAWSVASMPLVGALGVAIELPMFLVQGLTMAAAGVVLVTLYLDSLGRVLRRGGKRTLIPRLGVAYPLARRFRAGMTLGMFTIIVLTLVYMGEVSYMFRGRADQIAANLGGGFDVVVGSNPADPIAPTALASVPGVRAVAPVGATVADFTSPTRSRTAWPVSGVGDAFASTPPTLRDRGSFPSDAAAWRAVTADPRLAIVDDLFLQTPGGPNARAAEIGDEIVMTDPSSGRSQRFTVAALAESDFIGSGAFVSQDALATVFRERAVPSRYYVASNDPEAVVSRIRTTFVANGADAETIRGVVDTVLAQNSGFFTLMQQFVGAGLVVGVAGIGVIMVRAVRERRRQVGVLRSLGLPHAAVANVFVFEAGFIATLGVALGVVIGLVASYALAVSGADFAEGFTWGVPYGEVLVIVGVALVSATVAALLPARQAARIQPAVSLRVAD